MDLENHIPEIQRGIREGQFANEASVSQGIVLRILQALNWPIYDTQIVWPEYTLEGRRVDFALCHPRKNPVILIEVKMIGKHHNAERQLFEYAFHLGIPMAILTDGSEWHFFLPGEQGLYQDRRVYMLDLLERDTGEIIQRFKRYISYENVCKKIALQAAREDYENVAKQREINKVLPIAWSDLVNEPDDRLVDLLADKVEGLCGYKPEESLVATFLANRDLVTQPFQSRRETQTTDNIMLEESEFEDDETLNAEAAGSPYVSPFSVVDRNILPAGLADILEVCLEIYINGRGYNSAVKTLFERRKLKSIHTIYDKCTRSINIDTAGFKELASEKEKISAYLQSQYPEYEKQIAQCLGV